MPTIKKPNQHFDATLYTGNGETQTVTNAGGFQPDLVWLKIRSGTGQHVLTDSVRGVSKQVFSSLIDAETTEAGKGITAFNSNGFTLGDELIITGSSNANAATYVGWQWKAGEGTTTVNTSGTISSNVSVNTTAGFSVVEFTGTGANATVGHGLGVAPKMIILKRRNFATGWFVYHSSVPNTQFLRLQGTDAATTGTGVWNSTSPTSTVFSIGNDGNVNASGQTYINYCWAEIAGFSAFGSYTGNGSTDGPFLYTGFRPKFVMWKKSNATESWVIIDTSRDPVNLAYNKLYANGTSGDDTGTGYGVIDALSNGFKIRSSHTVQNNNGDTYIYAAFAEHPFKNSLAR